MRLIPLIAHWDTILSALILSAYAFVCTTGCMRETEPDARSVGVEGRRSDAIAEPTALETQALETKRQAAVVLRYDLARDRLTVRAQEVSLATLLDRLVAETGVEIVVLKPLELDELISIEFDGPLTQAFDVLLRGFNKVVISSSGPRRRGEGPGVRILLAGRPEATRWRGEPAEAAGAASERVHADASPAAEAEDPSVALLRAVDLGDSDRAVQIVEELIDGGVETEKDRAVERLLEYVAVAGLPLAFQAPVQKLVEDRVLNSSDPAAREAAADSLETMLDTDSQRFLAEVLALQRELRTRFQTTHEEG